MTVSDREELKRFVPVILSGGLPGFLMVAMAMLSNCFLNAMLSSLGSAAIAGVGLVRKVDQLLYAVNQGITQGMLPLVAYCYTSGRRGRMIAVIRFSAVCSEVFSLICMSISLLFAPQLIWLFIRNAETIRFGSEFLRMICLAIPVYTLTFVIIAVFQAVGRWKEAFVISILHKGTLDILLMLLIFRWRGAGEIVWATPISEVLALVIAAIFLYRFLKKDKFKDDIGDIIEKESLTD